MKHDIKVRNAAIALFACVTAAFLVFFIYMGITENVSVYKARESHAYTRIEDYTVERVADEEAPAGVRTIYRWKLDASESPENCLCFYLPHHYAQVYYDGELMYSLTADSNNRIGGSISSNWVTVAVYEEDLGKEVEIVLTPLYESVADNVPEFLLGSHFSIIFDQFVQDLPQLLISLLCIFAGIFIMAVQLYFSLRVHVKAWDMFCMGSFAVMLGLWRMTDTKSSPLLFSKNPMVLGYISMGMLFLCSIPLLLLAGTYFHGKKKWILRVLAMIGSVAAAIVLLLQVLGVADFKETLTVSHVMLLVTICVIPVTALFRRKRESGTHTAKSWFLLLLPIFGMMIDIALFYVYGESSNIFFALIAFIVYALITFVTSMLDATNKAYTDFRTGLTNKVHWNELMHLPVAASTVIMMLDLNGLKKVNDALGHEAGDEMILAFANILRRTLPKNSVICRWGGDEFTVMATGTNRARVEKYLDAIQQEVDSYNANPNVPPIFYAVGFVLSSENPDMSHMELLDAADRQMYRNKQEWYAENQRAGKDVLP